MRTTKEKTIKHTAITHEVPRPVNVASSAKLQSQPEVIDRAPAKHIKVLSIIGYVIFLLATICVAILFSANLGPNGAAFLFYFITIASLFSFIFILLALNKYNKYNKQIKHLNIREFLGLHIMNSINIVVMVILSIVILFGIIAIISILMGAVAGTI